MDYIFHKGDRIDSIDDSYVVCNPIAQHDYIQTYRLGRTKDNKAFLMKVLLPQRMPEELKFNGKPRIISYLSTSNIGDALSIVSWGEKTFAYGTCYYMISRFFQHGLLSENLKEDGTMDARQVLKMCLDIVESLMSMRSIDKSSFLHNDICPENIMFGNDSHGNKRAYLIDNEHITHIEDDGMSGYEVYWEDLKPRYCAPETLEGKTNEKSDVYSLGVVLYEAFFGEYPWERFLEQEKEFASATEWQLLKKVRQNEIMEPEESRRSHVEWIFELFKMMTRYDYQEESCDARPTLEHCWRLLMYTLIEVAPFKYHSKDIEDTKALDVYNCKEHENQEMELPSKQEASEEEKPAIDDSEFTNEELGYHPLVKAHNPKSKGFLDVAGMDDLKEAMKKRIIFLLKNPDIAKEYRIDYPNGMLLYGPPGCGKTFFAEKFAEECGCSYAVVKASDLGSTWVHGGQGKIAMLFKEARAKAPCVLCFDEFDAFAPKRETVNNANLSGEVNEFLSQLNNCGKDRIFVIATTNNPTGIDNAVLRSGRLDYKYYIPVPDRQTRMAVFRLLIEKRPHCDDIDYRELAKATEGYVTSDISLIANEAAMMAAYAKGKINRQMLMDTIANYKPSVAKTILREHELIRAKMESEVLAEIPIIANTKILN